MSHWPLSALNNWNHVKCHPVWYVKSPYCGWQIDTISMFIYISPLFQIPYDVSSSLQLLRIRSLLPNSSKLIQLTESSSMVTDRAF